MTVNYKIPSEELPFAETFFLDLFLSPTHHKLWTNLPKDFKKIVNNQSSAAFKINAKTYFNKFIGKEISSQSFELFDDFVDNPEKHQENSIFVGQLKQLKLYPNDLFPEWNKHIDTYNNLEKNNFSKENAAEIHAFLTENFFDDKHKDLISIDLLMQRDFNILLILLHLDAIIFRDNFQNISLYKYLTRGTVKGKRKPINHLFWNVVKPIALTEFTKMNNLSLDIPNKIPKDEDCMSLVSEKQAEKIKYAIRQLKKNKQLFYLSHIYLLVGSKRLYENSKIFSAFSLTGLWLIYMYSIFFIARYSLVQNKIYFYQSDLCFQSFEKKYKSESPHRWPSDLSS